MPTAFRTAAACPLSYPAGSRSGSPPSAVLAGAYLYPWERLPAGPPGAGDPVPWHSRSDRAVPGRAIAPFNLPFPSVPEWVEAQARRHGCTGAPQVLPAQGKVSGVRYEDCNTGTEAGLLHHCRAAGISGRAASPCQSSSSGIHSLDIDATRTMWDFFQRHPLPGKDQERFNTKYTRYSKGTTG